MYQDYSISENNECTVSFRYEYYIMSHYHYCFDKEILEFGVDDFLKVKYFHCFFEVSTH